MSVVIARHLPAWEQLKSEGFDIISKDEARSADFVPLRIGILNLMPEKRTTEYHFARVLGNSFIAVEVELLRVESYISTNTPKEHMDTFYTPWSDVKDQHFDGFIITGAPVEDLPFEDVKYWTELQKIFDWLLEKKISTFHVCWAAQAALYHFYNVPKHQLDHKVFGIFEHQLLAQSPVTFGMDDAFSVPVSRHTENRIADFSGIPELNPLIQSADAGLCLVENTKHNHFYMFNHLEYTAGTLGREYMRDRDKRGDVLLPKSYFPENNAENKPVNTWRANGYRMYGNWVRELYKNSPNY
ncbi:MAG: homoserine O-succinyltransferase [Alphaproteobacteria bacterium]